VPDGVDRAVPVHEAGGVRNRPGEYRRDVPKARDRDWHVDAVEGVVVVVVAVAIVADAELTVRVLAAREHDPVR
jgi:hypothetical protein